MMAAAAALVVSGAICSMTMRTNEIEILEETKTIYKVNGLASLLDKMSMDRLSPGRYRKWNLQ